MNVVVLWLLSLIATAIIARLKPVDMSLIEYSMAWNIVFFVIVVALVTIRTLLDAVRYLIEIHRKAKGNN